VGALEGTTADEPPASAADPIAQAGVTAGRWDSKAIAEPSLASQTRTKGPSGDSATHGETGRAKDSGSRARRAGFIVASGLLVLVAFVGVWGTVAGLRWPYDPDLFRNIAGGVAFRDGHPLSDPHYSGVHNWYSPLTGALLGIGSLVTSLPVNRLGTQGGAVLNLVTPLALCWVTARWFGRRVALGTLVAFLFVMGANYWSAVVASYSPWMFVPIYSLGLFILALAAVPAAVNRGSTTDALRLGVVVGVVALAHLAAAMILAAVVAPQFLRAGLHASRITRIRLARAAGISMSTALVVSAPFWLPVVVRYHGGVANEAPSNLVWPPLASGREPTPPGPPYGGSDATNIWEFLREFFWRWPMLVIAVGLSLCIARRLRRETNQPRASLDPARAIQSRRTQTPSSSQESVRRDAVWIVTTWTVVSFVGLIMASYRVVSFPFPSYHFLSYLSAALCIWFGISLAVIVKACFALCERIVGWQPGRLGRHWGAVTVAVLVAGIATLAFPHWHAKSDLVDGRSDALRLQKRFDDFAAVHWIRANTEPDDVFLISEPSAGLLHGFVQYFPGLAGRRTVNIESPEFSNPFVDWKQRHHDAQRMRRALESCRVPQFQKLAAKYGRVGYVLVHSAQPNTSDVMAPLCADALPTVYRNGGVSVHRINFASPRAGRQP
jgi:hypothetical protein